MSWRTCAICALALLVLLAGPAGAEEEAWALLERAADAKDLTFSGEALLVTWEGGSERASLVQVSGDGGWLSVDGDGVRLQLTEGVGNLARVEEGWLLGVPPVAGPPDEGAAAQRKYEAAVTGTDQLLDRPAHTVELRAHGDLLRERLWIDDETGFVLRRDTFDDHGVRARMAGWASLHLGQPPPATLQGVRVSRTRPAASLQRRTQQMLSVDQAGLEALRQADWAVPDVLPGGYAPVAAYAVAVEGSVPLQLVYADGLYSVSLFQQRGQLDPELLPDGAQTADVGWEAYEWPGALPRRMVWEADDTTFTLVGDAPPDEFLAIAGSLPRPSATPPLERLRRGFGTLWRRVSPWGG